jgi:glycosyltransferase involved in cell wall biosynthesis
MTPLKPELCFITNEIYPGTAGGIGRLITSTIGRLIESGYGITLLLACDSEAVQTFRRYAAENMPAVTLYSVDELLTELTPDEDIPSWAFHFFAYHQSYRIALALRKLCKRVKISGIEFSDYPGLGYVTLKWRRLWGDAFEGIPIWIRLHGTVELCDRADQALKYSVEKEQNYAMERYCLRHADGWISPSQETADWYRNVYQCSDVPVVIAPPSFEKIGGGHSHSRQLGTPPYRILFYGKLQKLKGIETFIDAALELCETSDLPLAFEMVGHEAEHPWGAGSYKNELERRIPGRWRDRFHFRGRILLDQLEQTALDCTLAVVPSKIETFCLAAHELNWIGIPLILNDIPGFRAYFQDGIDCRFYDGTSHHLAQVLLELLRQPDPFAQWTWNAPGISVANRDSGAYAEALKSFTPFQSPDQMSLQPLVSVVIPYYNMQDYVDATLTSVSNSTYSNWEVILVDDGSPTPEAQRKFAELEEKSKGLPRFKFLRKENGGLGSARNFGILAAGGDYILPLDSDDVIHPQYLEKAVRALNRLPEVSAVSCYVSYFADGQPPEQIIDYVIPYDLNPVLISLENRAGVACSIFRRDVFKRFSYNSDLISYEDWNLWWSMAEAGAIVEAMPVILYRYRRRATSMFNATAIPRHVYVMNRMADLHLDYLHQYGPEVFRMYVYQLNELRKENERLRSTPSGQMYTIVKQLYHEVRMIRSSTSFKIAQKLKQIYRSVMGLLGRQRAPVSRHTIAIQILNENNASSGGHEVWFGGMRSPDSMVYQLNSFQQQGNWSIREIEHPVLEQVLLATENGAALQTTISEDWLHLIFLNHPWSGKVKLKFDDVEQIIDLYANDQAIAYREYIWDGKNWNVSEVPWEKR